MNLAILMLAAATTVIHVPERLSDLKMQIKDNAANFNHVRLVNVAGAVSEKDWPIVTAFPASRVQISCALANLASSKEVDALLARPESLTEKFGPKAKLFVFVEDSDAVWPVVSSPASYCRVNIRPLKADKPDATKLRDRIAKQILRGINYAAGGGGSTDWRSVTYVKARTLADLDKCLFTIAPDAYFPLLECLRAVGGDEIVSFNHNTEE